jgi:hypothetical protein
VVVVVGAQVDLDPVHDADEDAFFWDVVVADREAVSRPRSAVSSTEKVRATVAGSRPSPVKGRPRVATATTTPFFDPQDMRLRA